MTTGRELARLQRDLNRFTDKFLYHVTPLRVDGHMGHHTRRRIRLAKYALGFKHHDGAVASERFLRRLRHPWTVRFSDPSELARAVHRRRRLRRHEKANERKAQRTTGVGTFDGKPVANWMIPYLQWARNNGWRGSLVSGWRDPAYSEQLCYRMCGAPTCAGRCAGRGSGHSQSTKPGGCVDVSYYQQFGEKMQACPFNPHLFNALGARDPVHFSVSGR